MKKTYPPTHKKPHSVRQDGRIAIEEVGNAKAFWRNEKLYVLDWASFGSLMDALAAEITADSFHPTTIVTIARGGLTPALHLANRLRCADFRILEVVRNLTNSIYSEKQEPQIRWASPTDNLAGSSVLLVDDITGAGVTLAHAIASVRSYGPAIVKTVAVVRNCQSAVRPDYCTAVADDWVVFPWENLDTEVNRKIVALGPGRAVDWDLYV